MKKLGDHLDTDLSQIQIVAINTRKELDQFVLGFENVLLIIHGSYLSEAQFKALGKEHNIVYERGTGRTYVIFGEGYIQNGGYYDSNGKFVIRDPYEVFELDREACRIAGCVIRTGTASERIDDLGLQEWLREILKD